MSDSEVQRRLAAFLAADVVAYTSMMEADEQATLKAWWSARKDIIDPRITEYGGRIVKHTGDGFLAEFSTVLDAVACAVAMQTELNTRNASALAAERMHFRMGVNLGDITVDDEDIYGDGVNIAARLEALADPGGICVSAGVHDQVQKRIGLAFEDMGAKQVKHVSTPIHVYRVLLGKTPETAPASPTFPAPRRWATAAAILFVVAAGGITVWWHQARPDVEPASIERMAFPLPDKPSIAVLPFDNLSGDPEQEFFSDGITENIITGLSAVERLFVIARNSTFTYKGTPMKVQRVAEDLGVRYVLEGSVQKSGDKVRITAQLIDALTGNHLWVERYDRDMTELFALQDEITDKIVVALSIELTGGEETRVRRKHTRSVKAWSLLGRGVAHFHRANKIDNVKARQLIGRAIEVDRGYALAYAVLAWTHWFDAFHGWSDNRALSIERASFLADKAQGLDDELPDVYALQGSVHLLKRRYDAAVTAAEKAVALNPNHASNTALLGIILHNAGRSQEAIQKFKTAMRLSPYYPDWFLETLGFAYLDSAQPDDALVAFATFLERQPAAIHAAHARLGRAFAYDALGQEDKARAEVAEAIEADAGISVTQFGKVSIKKDLTEVESGLAILRRLGLPE